MKRERKTFHTRNKFNSVNPALQNTLEGKLQSEVNINYIQEDKRNEQF